MLEYGIQLGNQLIDKINAYRSDKGMPSLKINSTLAQDQRELIQIFHKDFENFNKGYGFQARSDKYANKYYTEDHCLVYDAKDPSEGCYQQFLESPRIKLDLLREHDEAGAYCERHGNGQLCSLAMLKWKETA